MKNSRPLDKWQIRPIKLFKSQAGDADTCKAVFNIWAERCAITPEFAAKHAAYIVADLWQVWCSMLDEHKMDHDSLQLITDMQPDNQWKYGMQELNCDPHFAAWLRVLASRLRLTEVKYLTGWSTETKS